MKKMMACWTCLFVLGVCEPSYGALMEDIGPDSVIGHPTAPQTEWPEGIVMLPRHPSRVYSIWVNGNENFYFQAPPEQVDELLALFSKARMRDREVRITRDRRPVRSFKGDAIEYNVSLEILSGIVLAAYREKANGDTFEPCLTIYAGDDVAWINRLRLLDNIILHSDVEGVTLKSNESKPKRLPWYGKLQFTGAIPPADSVHLLTQITLWENNDLPGFKVAHADREGFFNVALSDVELKELREGRTWLTVTVGNWLTNAKRSDPRFPADLLAASKEQTKALSILYPALYYGRILFEDGSVPILNPEPWPGAQITVDFPYAGIASIDSQGYFSVYFTDEQYEKATRDKERKNIYIPDYTRNGEATARFVFSVGLLSQDKAAAGVARIPRPAPRNE
jgi:hypothetical protein